MRERNRKEVEIALKLSRTNKIKNLIFLFLIERWRIIKDFGLNEKTGTVFFDHKKGEIP